MSLRVQICEDAYRDSNERGFYVSTMIKLEFSVSNKKYAEQGSVYTSLDI